MLSLRYVYPKIDISTTTLSVDYPGLEMSQQPTNPLLQPPFFLIPGINPSAPISVQTEQIDQLNTLLLQEIDANFAKFHQVVTAKILPEIKRFALAGEPTREAAQVGLDISPELVK